MELNGFFNTLSSLMIKCEFKVGKCHSIVRISIFRVNFKDMLEPSDSIFKLAASLIAASHVIKQLLALRSLKNKM